MLHPLMAAPKTRKPKNPARRRSVLSDVGDEAKRVKLLETLDACGWNLSAAGRALSMTPQAVSVALQNLDPDAYAAAVKSGRIAGGRPSKNDT